jgi:hypothetical protein
MDRFRSIVGFDLDQIYSLLGLDISHLSKKMKQKETHGGLKFKKVRNNHLTLEGART